MGTEKSRYDPVSKQFTYQTPPFTETTAARVILSCTLFLFYETFDTLSTSSSIHQIILISNTMKISCTILAFTALLAASSSSLADGRRLKGEATTKVTRRLQAEDEELTEKEAAKAAKAEAKEAAYAEAEEEEVEELEVSEEVEEEEAMSEEVEEEEEEEAMSEEVEVEEEVEDPASEEVEQMEPEVSRASCSPACLACCSHGESFVYYITYYPT
jgi:midasin (ATPase involved in ribosome maturation)